MKPLARVKKKKNGLRAITGCADANQKESFLVGLWALFYYLLIVGSGFPQNDFISEIKLQAENKGVMILWITIIRTGYLISDSSGQSEARFVDALDNRISKERFASIEDLKRYSHVSAV